MHIDSIICFCAIEEVKLILVVKNTVLVLKFGKNSSGWHTFCWQE